VTEPLCGVVDEGTGVACDRPHGHKRVQMWLPVAIAWYDHWSEAGGVYFDEPADPLEVAS
jgi:hypothetical protein